MITVVRAPNPGAFTLDGTNTWILEGSVVFDPGPAIASHAEAIRSAAPDMTAIFVTHRHEDHAPAAPLLKRAGVTIFAPPGVLDDSVVDRRLRDGDRIGVGNTAVEAIATPGHTAEHFCFLTADRDLVTGDTILGEGTTAVFPPDGNMGDYIASLRKLRELQPRRILPGHGPIRDDAVAWIDFYIEHRLDRERQVIVALAGNSLSIPELRSRVYPDLDTALHGAAEAQMEAHLMHLLAQGKVSRLGGRFSLTWQ